MNNDAYHVPVMLEESVRGLDLKIGGTYVDLTFGGGGHSQAILDRLEKGHLYAFDQDDDAELNAKKIKNRSFTFLKGNFRYLKKYLKAHGVLKVDGILADLGVSSHQIDEAARGFSTRLDGPLDMRMFKGSAVSAATLIAEVEESELKALLREQAEIRNASAVARAICTARANQSIASTAQLVNVVSPYAPKGKLHKFLAQVFQAIRIKVNDELAALEEMMSEGVEMLQTGGRFVIMTYHSIEDRMVKNFFSKGNIQGEAKKDFYGNLLRPLKPITRKPMVASAEEIGRNKRARSAKLRVAEKI